MDNYNKYLKYKNKYCNLKTQYLLSKRNQTGGNMNFDMNFTIYTECQNNPRYSNPCLENFGVELDSLSKMEGKDRSSQSEMIIGTSKLNIDDKNYPIAIKVFMSQCTSILNRRERPDELQFLNEISICKQLTELFLRTRQLQNISWFYYGGICEYSFETENRMSKCSGKQILGDHHIYSQDNRRNSFMRHWYDYYNNIPSGDTTSFMIVEKSTGSMNSLLETHKRNNTNLKIDTLQTIMSLILQTLLALNVINNHQYVAYFNHNDLHTGNVLYSPTDEDVITFNLENGNIRLRTFNILAKIWDFGTSELTLKDEYKHLEVSINKSNIHPQQNKFKIINVMPPACVLDIPTFMNFINRNFITQINPDLIQTLPEANKRIYNDIIFIVNYYIGLPIEPIIENCGRRNKEISNLIFDDRELNQILMRYNV